MPNIFYTSFEILGMKNIKGIDRIQFPTISLKIQLIIHNMILKQIQIRKNVTYKESNEEIKYVHVLNQLKFNNNNAII